MLPQAKVDELVEWLNDWVYRCDLDRPRMDPSDKTTLRDKIDDALHDAYGCGEADERKAVIGWIRRGAQIKATDPPEYMEMVMNHTANGLADDIERGRHDPACRETQLQIARLRKQTGQEPPSADSSARG